MEVGEIFDQMPISRFNGLWTIKLGGPKWDFPILLVHFGKELPENLGKYTYYPKGRPDAAKIGDKIGKSGTSWLQLLIANDKEILLVEVNPEYFVHKIAKNYSTDTKSNFISRLKACMIDDGPFKCIELLRQFIKVNHAQ